MSAGRAPGLQEAFELGVLIAVGGVDGEMISAPTWPG
jgi:hypothetical protein